MFLIIRPGISFECESERSVNEIVGFLAIFVFVCLLTALAKCKIIQFTVFA